MNGLPEWKSSYAQEFKACTSDDELKVHLRSKIHDGISPLFPLLSYKRFQASNRFRLLALRAGGLDHKIQCKLGEFDLSSTPAYVALSYTWGDKARTLTIECDQHTALISTNLYSALLHIRRRDKDLTLWVDALCIDQASEQDALHERAQQGRIMDRIFATVDEVLIDLGGAGKEETRRFMKGYRDFQDALWKGPSYDGQFERDDPSRAYGPGNPFWATWHRFLQRPWFSRTWIIQELVLARRVTMLLGSTEIDPWKLGEVLGEAVFHQGSVSQDHTARIMVGDKSSLERLHRSHLARRVSSTYSNMLYYHGLYEIFELKQSLPDLLDLNRNMHATDARDHIYVLAGLVKNWDTLENRY